MADGYPRLACITIDTTSKYTHFFPHLLSYSSVALIPTPIVNLLKSEDWVLPPSSCCSQSDSDGNDPAPSSISSQSSDHRQQQLPLTNAVSRWEIAVPYRRNRRIPTDITIRHTANRFDGDPGRDNLIAAPSHVNAIDDLTNLLNHLVPNGDEPRDPDMLTYLRNIVRMSKVHRNTCMAGRCGRRHGDEESFRLTVDVDTDM